jgi:cell fate regulator YaaT (PSP1 superfamily)
VYLQDWLTLKVFFANDNKINKDLKSGDKVVYVKDWKKFIANYIGYKCEPDDEVKFLYKLSPKQLEKFYSLDKKAKKIFSDIKDDLKIVFPKLRFITAKMNYSWDLLYLYFYYEDRIDFRPYLWELKKLIWMNFFLYQVGARDRIRLDPASKDICWDCWHKLCCIKSMCRLDSISSDTISLQNLQTQWLDSQKWVCGKLKCCLKYEEEIYKSELKNYPKVGTEIEKDWKKYTIIWINVLSKYVFMKDEEWFIIKENLDNLK